MKDLESQLAGQPLRSAPPEWRAHILRNARAVSLETPAVPWWRGWLSPQPIALAAAWLVIGFLAFSTPEERPAPAPATLAQWEEHLKLQQELLAESVPPSEPRPSTRVAPHGAVLSHRQNPFA